MKNTKLSNTSKLSIIGIFLLALLNNTYLFAQEKDTRQVATFNEIAFEGAYDVLLKEGSTTTVEIIASDNVSPKDITTEVKNGKLYIRNKEDKRNGTNWNINGKKDMPKLIISYTRLESIENSGVVNLKTDNVIKGQKFQFDASGAGNFEVELDVAVFTVEMSGAMSLKVSGKATEQKYELSGAGSIEAYNLVGEQVKVELSGAGSAKVHAKKSLDAEISGVGSIRYKGNPAKVKAESGLLGSIKEE